MTPSPLLQRFGAKLGWFLGGFFILAAGVFLFHESSPVVAAHAFIIGVLLLPPAGDVALGGKPVLKLPLSLRLMILAVLYANLVVFERDDFQLLRVQIDNVIKLPVKAPVKTDIKK